MSNVHFLVIQYFRFSLRLSHIVKTFVSTGFCSNIHVDTIKPVMLFEQQFVLYSI